MDALTMNALTQSVVVADGTSLRRPLLLLLLLFAQVKQCSALGAERNSLCCSLLSVVSHTAANAIVQLLQLVTLHERTVIMSMLEAISHHELVAHGRDVRLRRRGRHQSGYAMLLYNFRGFVYVTDQDADQDSDTDTDQDSDTAAETAAAVTLGHRAVIVIRSMQALRNRVPFIRGLYQAVDTRFHPMEAVNPASSPADLSELSSVPSNDVVNYADDDRDTGTV
jgi:hypothetical protein